MVREPADEQLGRATQLGIVTTSSATAFTAPAETIYDFVTDPTNWTTAYPGHPRISNVR